MNLWCVFVHYYNKAHTKCVVLLHYIVTSVNSTLRSNELSESYGRPMKCNVFDELHVS